jgi:hypothetical protein
MNYQKASSATYMSYWMVVRPSQEEEDDDDAQKNHRAKERPTSAEKLGLGLRNKLISKL